jgi:hypothetical protein
LWLAFGGFYLILALAIGTVWLSSITVASNGSDKTSASGATSHLIALGSPSHAFNPSGSAVPIASSTATPKSTASSTPTPKPTKKPTPKPTKKPTPKPTPVNFVKFVNSGGGKTAVYTIKQGGTFTWIIQGRSTAMCDFHSAENNRDYDADTKGNPQDKIPGSAGQTNYVVRTGVGSYAKTWPVGTYHLTATCVLTGYSNATASITLTVTKP